MKTGRLLLLLFFSLAISGSGEAQDMARVRATIAELASEGMHGRGYVHNGDKTAAAYIQAQFREAGLKAFTPEYLQHFRISINTFPGKLSLKAGSCYLRPGEDFIADAASPAGKGKARMTTLDTLIFTDEQAGRRFLKQNLEKRALLFRLQDTERLRNLPDSFRLKFQQARVHVELHPKLPVASLSQQQAQVPKLEVLQERWPGKTRKIRYQIEAKLEPSYQTQNVLAYVPGKVQPDSFLVFTAHYDHLGRQGKQVYFPGAHDNASGTAMLLELAHWYSRPENQPDYSIAFMAFGAEEAGLLGSKFYVENPLFPLRQIKFLLNLDLLATGEDGLMVVNGRVFEKEFRLLNQLNAQHHYLPAIKVRGKAANSDHFYFTEKGVRAFFIYTLGGNVHYHNIYDKADTLPLTKFREIFRLVTDFMAALQQKGN